jgi:hypothetical protein
LTNFSLLSEADLSALGLTLKSAAKTYEKLVNQKYATLFLDAL